MYLIKICQESFRSLGHEGKKWTSQLNCESYMWMLFEDSPFLRAALRLWSRFLLQMTISREISSTNPNTTNGTITIVLSGTLLLPATEESPPGLEPPPPLPLARSATPCLGGGNSLQPTELHALTDTSYFCLDFRDVITSSLLLPAFFVWKKGYHIKLGSTKTS